MSKKGTVTPYQPKTKSINSGHRPFMAAADALIKREQEKKAKEDAILAKLGFKLTFDDVISLLQDEQRLKEVVSKLKLKVFW